MTIHQIWACAALWSVQLFCADKWNIQIIGIKTKKFQKFYCLHELFSGTGTFHFIFSCIVQCTYT